MAKISHFLAEYRTSIQTTGFKNNSHTPPKIVIRRFIRLFKSVDDSRIKGMIEYPLSEILLIAFLAVLGNASTWIEISRFGNAKEKWLKNLLNWKTEFHPMIHSEESFH